MEVPLLIGLATALIIALVGHRLSLGREQNSVRRAAAVEFHKAFADTLLNLQNDAIGTARVIQEFDLRHSVAIAAFRPYVPFGKRASFDKTVHCLDTVCAQYKNVGPLTLFSTELGPVASANREAIISAIRDLLALAPLI